MTCMRCWSAFCTSPVPLSFMRSWTIHSTSPAIGYKDLMKKAVLDAASRKKRAAVIKAGVQISRLALGVAGKLALV